MFGSHRNVYPANIQRWNHANWRCVCTAGIECVNTYILPHKGGIGDHRCFILDFSSASVIGTRFQNIVRCPARRLHFKSSRLVQAYNRELDNIDVYHFQCPIFYKIKNTTSKCCIAFYNGAIIICKLRHFKQKLGAVKFLNCNAMQCSTLPLFRAKRKIFL